MICKWFDLPQTSTNVQMQLKHTSTYRLSGLDPRITVGPSVLCQSDMLFEGGMMQDKTT